MSNDRSGDERSQGMTDAEHRQMERQHIFCVNGSAEFLDLLRELLQEEHYNVTTTNFVPRTFDQIATLQPNLIIVDLVVAEQAGWDLLERLQREAVTNQIPVIATSTDARLLDRAKVHQARYGARHYLVKPFDIDDLIETVDSLIGKA